jgi:hypothetical protein
VRPLEQVDQSIVERLITLLRADGIHHEMLRLETLRALRRAAAMRGDDAMVAACFADMANVEVR